MIAEALIERLDQPNRNGHIYSTKCIEDAIINNEFIQKRVRDGQEFIIYGNKSKNAENVISCVAGGNYPVSDIIGKVLKYYIKDNCLYATIDFKDDFFTDKVFMAGTGNLSEDGVIDNYEFGVVFSWI